MSNPKSELQQAICSQVIEQINHMLDSVADLDQFAQQIVDLILTEFSLYFIGMFLVDSTGQWIRFRAGTGEAGRVMREYGYQIGIDSPGMVGFATRENKVCIDDFRSSGGFFVNSLPSDIQMKPTLSLQFVEDPWKPSPLLPDTWSQIILPLRTDQGVIGVIDIHSHERDDFSQQDISIFLPLADHIAWLCMKLLKLVNDETDGWRQSKKSFWR